MANVARCTARESEWRTGYAGITITTDRHVHPLKVRAQQNRIRGRRRPGQPSLGTPQVHIMADQEAVSFFPTLKLAAVLPLLERAHRPQSIRTDVVHHTGTKRTM